MKELKPLKVVSISIIADYSTGWKDEFKTIDEAAGRAHYKLEAEQSSEIVIIPSGLLSSTLDTLALARLILT